MSAKRMQTNQSVDLDEDDAPELTPELIARAKLGRDVFPPEVLAAFGKTRGRPRVPNPKRAVSLRLDPDVLDAFKATGKGWQGRINEALRKAMPGATS